MQHIFDFSSSGGVVGGCVRFATTRTARTQTRSLNETGEAEVTAEAEAETLGSESNKTQAAAAVAAAAAAGGGSTERSEKTNYAGVLSTFPAIRRAAGVVVQVRLICDFQHFVICFGFDFPHTPREFRRQQ